jgi:hypothetical protein
MVLELKKLVREAAGAFGARFAERARAVGRVAHAGAGRVWRDVGELLRLEADRGGAAATTAVAGTGDGAASELNAAVGPQTQALVEAMVEVLDRSGYRELRADVGGRHAPDVVRGTVRSHRPSVAAVGGGCPVLVDVFVPSEMSPEEQLSRWHLFSSAAAQLGGEFHVVVPETLEGISGRAWTRRVAEATGLAIHHVWEV